MNVFQRKFHRLLNEAPELAELPIDTGEEEIDPGLEGEGTPDLGLDQGTEAGEFDDVPDNPINSLRKQQFTQTIGTIEGWINDVEAWVDQLNGLDDGSMNAILNKADCDSVMADVRRSESKKISRLAQDLSSLSESLKQYLLTAQQKKDTNETI